MGQCPTCGRRTTGFAFCPDDGAELLPDRDAAPAAGSALPRELDRYRLLRAIGQGGTSDVFEAEHLHTGKRVAIKLLRRELAGDPHAIERLRREARTASSIGHRNIVHVEDFGVAADGAVYLAMEWLEGETLDARIERGPLAQAAAIDLVLQIAAGLGAAHAAGVVHRDLKPANVFLVPLPGGGDQVKLLDFGIAKLVMSESRLTRTGTFLGTPDYVAPEQALGDEVDERADLYGLGVVLYQLVTGTLPFTGATFMAVLHRHTTQAPEAPSHRAPHRGISVELEAVILRCLAKRPVDRFASAEEVSRALEEVREATTPAPARTRTRARTGTLTPTPAPARSRAPSAPSAPPPAPARPRAPSAPSAPSAPPEPRGESPWPTPGPGDPDDGDSLEIPGRRRPARLWLPVLILAAGAAGAAGGVLALRGRRDDRVAPAPTPDPASAPSAAPLAPTAPITSPATAPPAATPPALTPPPPPTDPAATAPVWQLPGRARSFDYTVRVRPRVVRAGQSFQIDVDIRPGPALSRMWSRGERHARLTFVGDRGRRVELRGEVPIGDGDRLSTALTLPRAGTYRVELALHAGADELGGARFDLCVGADPIGPRARLDRVCPGMPSAAAPGSR